MKKKQCYILFLLSMCFCILYAKPQTNYEIVKDNLKLIVFEKTGNFCLYNLSTKGIEKYIPLYDDRSLGRTNKFYVYKDNKVYELKKRIEKPFSIEADEDSIKIIYEFTESFYVVQTLSFTEKYYGTSGPLLKIQTVIENISGEPAEFGLKALFDTSLGEGRRIPLYTDLRTGIFKETALEPKFEKDSVIISANSDAACLFLINHTEASIPEKIHIANWERLQSLKWLPSIVQGRLFSTKYSHNDSALLFVWPKKILENNEQLSITMFIGYYDFLRKNYSDKRESYYQDLTEPIPQGGIENIKPLEKNKNTQNADDYRYISELLDKILKVEANPNKVSDEDIEKLLKQANDAIDKIQE